jgi:ADP-dependent NAD(P)H-hydrate dehydratase / NAD(P)H-hydrate epimerase
MNYIVQKPGQPLYPDIIWSRPENKAGAGRLLIVGGNRFGIASVAESYDLALKARAGAVRVLLPDAYRRAVGKANLPDCFWAPSTTSGGFSQKALDELLLHTGWADGVLLAGDFGKSSETSLLLSKYLAKANRPIFASKDSVDLLLPEVFNNKLTIYPTLSQLQAVAKTADKLLVPLSSDALQSFASKIQILTDQSGLTIVTYFAGHIWVAAKGQQPVATAYVEKLWQNSVAARSAVWALQQPTKQHQSIVTSIIN